MSLEAWLEVAWAELIKGTPMMANPGEYHTMMYELFWNGNAPAQLEDKDGKRTRSVTTPKAAKDDLEALFAEAKKLRGEPVDQ